MINQYNKQIISFNSHIQQNLLLITKISEIENSILHYYKKIHDVKKKTSLVLSTQLFNGYFKIYKENGYFSNHRADSSNGNVVNKHCKLDHIMTKSNKKYIIKISGLWENKDEIGISYKFIEVYG